MHRICVNCGSNHGASPAYREAAQILGRCIAQQGMVLVYGGADVGLMGAVANAALSGGGEVIGVIPQLLCNKVGHKNLTELHVVNTMHERKQRMMALADGFVVLPGGLGTLEELFEVLTWSGLGIHGKPCGLLNVTGYYDRLLEFLDHVVDQRFMPAEHRSMIVCETSAGKLLERLRNCRPPTVQKWLEGESQV